MDAALVEFLAHQPLGIVLHIVGNHRPLGTHGLAGKTASARSGLEDREGSVIEEVANVACAGLGTHERGVAIDDSDPRHDESTRLDSDTARRLQYLLTFADAHDRAIDAAQHGVHAIEAVYALLRANLLRDILQSVEPTEPALRIRVPRNRLHHLADVDPAAVISPESVFQFPAQAVGPSLQRGGAKPTPIRRMDEVEPAARTIDDFLPL